jgi:prepilin-type N-terminal cleavage/methylation domain-containing protein
MSSRPGLCTPSSGRLRRDDGFTVIELAVVLVLLSVLVAIGLMGYRVIRHTVQGGPRQSGAAVSAVYSAVPDRTGRATALP